MKNLDEVVSSYLTHLSSEVSEKYTEKLILSHPDFPSLLCVSETMERLGVRHHVAKISKDDLLNLETPYLLHVETNGGEMVLIKSPKDLTASQGKLQYWSGVVLQAEPFDSITDSRHNIQFEKENLTKKLSWVLFGAISTLLILEQIIYFNFLYFIMIASALCGLFIGYLLIAKDLGIKYARVEEFCNTSTLANCDKVLDSAGATLFGFISLSDIVVTYFATLLMIAMLVPFLSNYSNYIVATLAASSFLSIPIVSVSLYYQKFVVKSWCKLCLLVVCVLTFQTLLYVYFIRFGFIKLSTASITTLAVLAVMFITSFIIIVLIKQRLILGNVAQQTEVESQRVKRALSVFLHLLHQSPRIDDTPLSSELAIGRYDAPVQVIMVLNLFCNPCKEHSELIFNLASMYPDKINVLFRFVQNGSEIGNHQTSVNYLLQFWLNHIHKTPDESHQVENLLRQWYSNMSLEKFRATCTVTGTTSSELVDRLESNHYLWTAKTKVTSTPSIFINGYKLPKTYSIEDLMAMIPGLAATVVKSNGFK